MTEPPRPLEPRPVERRSRRGRLESVGAALALLCLGTAATIGVRGPVARRAHPSSGAVAVDSVVVPAPSPEPLAMTGALVLGARRDWAKGREKPLDVGEPVPVHVTAYCLQGTTRRDQPVRQGIVAADPRLFPLGRYVEVYVGRRYHGRFLVDDTGARVRDGVLDIWTPSCHEARRFGRRRGTAVLVPRPRGAASDTLLTGRLDGVALR